MNFFQISEYLAKVTSKQEGGCLVHVVRPGHHTAKRRKHNPPFCP